jgi:hypothetical protein
MIFSCALSFSKNTFNIPEYRCHPVYTDGITRKRPVLVLLWGGGGGEHVLPWGDTDGAAMDGAMFDTARVNRAFSVYSKKIGLL